MLISVMQRIFQLETPNVSFKHVNRGSKGYWGQRSPIIVQGHRKSPSAKSIKIAISDTLFHFYKSRGM